MKASSTSVPVRPLSVQVLPAAAQWLPRAKAFPPTGLGRAAFVPVLQTYHSAVPWFDDAHHNRVLNICKQ